MSASKCDRCGEVVTDLDAGFSPAAHAMQHHCGGAWRVVVQPEKSMLDPGDRVRTPRGAGVVVYRRMAPPSYAEVEVYSVKLDGVEHVGVLYAAALVRAEGES